jgi:hypothetical protein
VHWPWEFYVPWRGIFCDTVVPMYLWILCF